MPNFERDTSAQRFISLRRNKYSQNVYSIFHFHVFKLSLVGSSIPCKLLNSVFFPFLVMKTRTTITANAMANIVMPAIDPDEREPAFVSSLSIPTPDKNRIYHSIVNEL